MKKLFILGALLFGSILLGTGTVQATGYTEGVHYKKLEQQQPTAGGDKIEVLEFFWYGCPHCFTIEPYINTWKKTKPVNVSFTRVPAIFRPDWEVQARTYYALSNMGIIEELHGEIFKAIHKDKLRLNKKGLMVDFLVKNGVDRKRFEQEYSSFSVDSMVRKAKKQQTAYKIQGVPTVAINGKYLTSGSMSGSYENMMKIIDYLIKKESK